MRGFKNEIVKELGVLSEDKSGGIKKELNIVSGNEGKPKFDIREWGEENEIIGNGITLTLKEVINFVDLLTKNTEDIVKIFDPKRK